jgi:O-glycosyl hydrolase
MFLNNEDAKDVSRVISVRVQRLAKNVNVDAGNSRHSTIFSLP